MRREPHFMSLFDKPLINAVRSWFGGYSSGKAPGKSCEEKRSSPRPSPNEPPQPAQRSDSFAIVEIISDLTRRTFGQMHRLALALIQIFYIPDPAWRKREKYQLLGREILNQIGRDAKQSSNTPLMQMLGSHRELETEHQERANFHRSNAAHSLQNALHHLAKLPDASNARGEYKAFLRQFRRALQAQELAPDVALRAPLHHLAHVLFTAPDISTWQRELVEQFAENAPSNPSAPAAMGKSEKSKSAILFGQIGEKLRSVRAKYYFIERSNRSKRISFLDELWGKFKGQTFRLFDPPLQGNPAYRKFLIETSDGRKLCNLRLPTPTMRNRIAPEFREYLRDLKARKQIHTYINFQRTLPNGFFDVEQKRSALIHALADEEEFRGTFFAFSLDKDSPFYLQCGAFGQQLVPAETFIETFNERLFSERSQGYHMPTSLRSNGAFRAEIRELLDKVWRQCFAGEPKLTRSERRDFLEIAYLVLIDTFVRTTGANYFNNSCKDCIDRGGGSNALMYFVLTMFMARRNEEKRVLANLQNFESMMFGDALWARKRAILVVRLNRALSAAERLLQSSHEDGASMNWLQRQLFFQKTAS